MRVAIVGSRKIEKLDISRIAAKLPPNCTQIISGGAVGVDSAAERLANELGVDFVKFEPDYKTYGKKAPLIRNIKIVENADMVLAFWDFSSRGTAHAIVQCLTRQIPVRIFRLSENM